MKKIDLKKVFMELGNTLVTEHSYNPPQSLPRLPPDYDKSTTVIKMFTDFLNKSPEARAFLQQQFDFEWSMVLGETIESSVTIDVEYASVHYEGKTYLAGCGEGKMGGASLGEVYAVRCDDEKWVSTRNDCLKWFINHGLPVAMTNRLLVQAENLLAASREE